MQQYLLLDQNFSFSFSFCFELILAILTALKQITGRKHNFSISLYFLPAPCAHQKNISSLIVFSLSDPSRNTPPLVDWDSRVASPIFGASSSMKNNSSTSHAPCILDSGLKPNLKTNLFNNPSSSRSHKSRSKSEDVAFVAPLNLGTDINSVISQASINRQMVVKKNTNEAVTCAGNTCAAKNDVIKSDFLLVHQKQLEGRCAKRKKAEDEHAISCEKTSFNKENSVPFRSDVQHINGEHTVDKPLDLSDRFSGVRCQEKKQGSEEICKNRLKQVTLHDIFSQLGKPIPESSSSIQNANNESCLFGRDLQEESYVQEAMLGKTFPDKKNHIQMKEEVPPFKIAPLPSSAETEQLFDDVKVWFSDFFSSPLKYYI